TGALLQFDLRKQPAFQILPSGNFVLEARGAGLDGFQMGLQDFVNQAFLDLEIVIELALPGSRGFNDLVRAGGANPLLVKQVSGSPNDAKPGFRAPHKSRFHRLPLLVPVSTIVNGLFVESGRPLGSILYLISVSRSSINESALQRFPISRRPAPTLGDAPSAGDCTSTSRFRRGQDAPKRKRSKA